MQSVSEILEKYTDTSPSYTLQGKLQKHQKEIALDTLCAVVEMNENIVKLMGLLTKPTVVENKVQVSSSDKVSTREVVKAVGEAVKNSSPRI